MATPPLDQWRRSSDAQPLHRALGIRADAIGEGMTQYRVVRAPGAAGGIDGAAGGDAERVSTFAITTAADLAIVTATSTTIDRRRETMNGTAELNLTYVAHPRGEALVRATVVHRAARMAVADVRVTDTDGVPVAYGRATYSIRPGAEA